MPREASHMLCGNAPINVFGIVSNVDDPENLGRVKAIIDTFGKDFETDWAPILTPMAGPGAGFYAVPQVGDTVAMGFMGYNLNYPFIFGSVWSDPIKPPRTSQDAKDGTLVYRSRTGHIMIFDDKNKRLTVQSSSGHKMTMEEETVMLSDKNGNNFLQINALDGAVLVTAASKLELSAPNIEIHAGRSLKVDTTVMDVKSTTLEMNANASLSLDCGGILTINGSMVKIN